VKIQDSKKGFPILVCYAASLVDLLSNQYRPFSCELKEPFKFLMALVVCVAVGQLLPGKQFI
jgi:hypothetical protein